MMLRIFSGLAALVIAGSALGHHSNSALDLENVVTFEGTVTEYTLRNPHSYFVVDSINESGETVSWEVQMGSAISMRTRGWTPDTLSLGDQVVVGLHAARDGRPYGLFNSVERDGDQIRYTLEWDEPVCFQEVGGLTLEVSVLEIVSAPGQPEGGDSAVGILGAHDSDGWLDLVIQ